MELIYLTCSNIFTSLISLTFSLLRLTRTRDQHVSIYRRPVHHSFSYTAKYALFELDHAPNVPPGHLWGDSFRSWNRWFCVYDVVVLNIFKIGCYNGVSHIYTNDSSSFGVWSVDSGPVRRFYAPKTFLLTIPPSVGYEQNPLSLYYCYELEESTKNLKKCIAEVTNTPWGEKVSFLFNPNSDLVAKALHVSPFMDMLGSWKIKANEPGDSIFIMISVHHPKLGDFFTASLTAKKASSVTNHALFFWLMPHKVALWIYWHALKLWWKGVPFVQHPRYSDPKYRQEALVRDSKLPCMSSQIYDFDPVNSEKINRCFKWRDAKWPWS